MKYLAAEELIPISTISNLGVVLLPLWWTLSHFILLYPTFEIFVTFQCNSLCQDVTFSIISYLSPSKFVVENWIRKLRTITGKSTSITNIRSVNILMHSTCECFKARKNEVEEPQILYNILCYVAGKVGRILTTV